MNIPLLPLQMIGCTKCLEKKVLTEFSIDKRQKRGRNSWCKQCVCKNASRWYAENTARAKCTNKASYQEKREERLKKSRQWAKANPEKRKDIEARYRAASTKECRAASARYRANHAEKYKAKNRRWSFENRGKTSSYSAARRASELQRTPAWADIGLVSDIYELANIYREAGFDCEVDHIVPLRGRLVSGLHTHNNLTVVTTALNRSKGNAFDPETHQGH